MRAEQPEATGGTTVAEGRIAPVIRVVTCQAFVGIPVGAMLLLIIALMTGEAILIVRRVEEGRKVRRRRVARRARQRVVGAEQAEPVGRTGMAKRGVPPVGVVVARHTGVRKTVGRVLLLIVRLMTLETVVFIGRVEQGREVRRRGMACRAIERLVRTEQGKAVGDGAVIKRGVLPIVGSVAGQARHRETGTRVLLLVVVLVAGIAVVVVRRVEQGLETRRRGMTGRTGKRFVRAE